MNTVWIISIITPVIAASFIYLFKLFETADAMRKQISDCHIWTGDLFPKGVADIEGHYDWNILVGGYYVALELVYQMIGRASLLALILFVLCIFTILSDSFLLNIPLRGHISALMLAQAALMACAVSYFFWINNLVHGKSKMKGQVDFAVTRCQRAMQNLGAAGSLS